MMQLRDPEAASMLARMRQGWAAGLFPAPELSTVRGRPPKPSKEHVQKHSWNPHGIAGLRPHNALNYAAWCAEVAAYLSEPRTYTEIGNYFAITHKAVRDRIERAKKQGHWPPPGLRVEHGAGGVRRFVAGVTT